jgi:hypothetical protein
MANAHFYSAGMELPLQTLAPTVSPAQHGAPFDTKDGVDIDLHEVDPHGDLTVHSEEMPEGPTVTRWEEWAYVSDKPRRDAVCSHSTVFVLQRKLWCRS